MKKICYTVITADLNLLVKVVQYLTVITEDGQDDQVFDSNYIDPELLVNFLQYLQSTTGTS